MSNIKKFRIKSFKEKNVVLKLEKISFKFGKKIILDNLNLELGDGQILGLLGPNGAGKSTIFNLIIGLIKPNIGNIFINNIKVNELPIYLRTNKFKVGYVPQYGGYFNDLTLFENLKAVAEIVIENKDLIQNKINYLISKFELDNVRDINAKFLSGGQKKKISNSIIIA